MRNAVLTTKCQHVLQAAHTQPRFFRSGFVIKTGVKYSAIVPALVPPPAGFLFQQSKFQSRSVAQQLPGSAQTDEATANDDNIVRSFPQTHTVTSTTAFRKPAACEGAQKKSRPEPRYFFENNSIFFKTKHAPVASWPTMPKLAWHNLPKTGNAVVWLPWQGGDKPHRH
jgi:hypothetical protein